MTLSDRYKDLDHVPGHKEWILLKAVCEELDALKTEAEVLERITHRVMSVAHEKLNTPTYGPMLEEEEN